MTRNTEVIYYEEIRPAALMLSSEAEDTSIGDRPSMIVYLVYRESIYKYFSDWDKGYKKSSVVINTADQLREESCD